VRAAAQPLAGLALLAACGARYRAPQDSEPMRRDIEDRNTESRVRMALARDPETAAYPGIRVRCRGGVVTLEGEVDRLPAKRRAAAVARGCEGVVGVNDLIVPTARG